MGIILALEGGVCAGKSSVSRIIEASGTAVQSPDYMDLLPNDKHEMLSRLSPIDRTSVFLGLDERRLAGTQTAQRIILDRCALTVFAFEYACVATGRNAAEPKLTELIERYNLNRPHSVIFLDVSDSVRVEREAVRKNHVLPMLLEPAFNCAIRRFFVEAAQFMPIQFINSEAHTSEEIATEVKEEFSRAETLTGVVSNWVPLLSWAFDR